ncbi:uncharacterized protein AMSG_03993 [Thecamonas trahens ATCC 50062]|uniref:Conserved oligomeric Golgi complex subunit 4 n=1 Tax=Thecamonas trahens ATCC 50062 TaxID=461836 RepID=A0A0L0D6Q6_THETB|nr:hypothetical protein AMSG_03993 [Thecamonas trahens ATCC 50062]KNC47766.1 hypothetical protein AMSG_03993 [Thecamonas trahens ATCC 50062]|eukprot:XP_013759244.1 hypothetical protein AMSG_03993 [Thecamonas trahens ATCC 50062]
MEVGGVADVVNLTKLEDIQKALAATSQRERELDSELDALLAQQGQLTKRIALVRKAVPSLTTAQREARKVAARVDDTCTLAESVSGRVRELNTALERIDATLESVTEILNLKYCVEGISAAMDAADYEQAATYVAKYAAFDEAVLEQTSTEALVEAQARLKTEVSSQFAAAVEALDRDAVLRFGKLFAPIGLQAEGVAAYAGYLCKAIEFEFDKVFEGLQATLAGKAPTDEEEPATFVSVLTHLYDLTAFCIESEEAVVADMFGGASEAGGEPGSTPSDSDTLPFLVILGAIQAKVDELACKVLELFQSTRSLTKLARTISSASMASGKSGKGGTSSAGLPSTKQVDLLLYEMATISNRTEMFDAFLRKTAAGAVGEGDGTGEAAGSVASGLVHVSSLNKMVQEMIASYLSLEMYFMNESVARAIAMDEVADDSHTSSMIDDVFYVVSKCARRSVSTFSTNSVCAMVNNINFVLSESLVPLLQSQIEATGASLTAALEAAGKGKGKGGKDASETVQLNCAVVLNNLDQGAKYIPQLRTSIEADVADLKFAAADKAKIEMCLTDLSDSVALFESVLKEALDNVSSSLQPRLKPLTSALLDIPYELSEAQFAANERTDPFVSSLISGLSGVVAPFKAALSAANYDAFIASVMVYVARRLESDVRRKRFNQLGALQFDKDVRALIAFFSSLTSRPVRDKFARLTQIATLLNVEAVGEVMEYWGTLNWALKPAEVKRILRLRVEFSTNDVNGLKLE